MKQNTKKNKSRIIALLVAVLALVPVCLLSVGAYPAQDIAPTNGFVSLGVHSEAYAWQHIASVELGALSPFARWQYTFVNVSPEFNSSVDWSYACVQMSIAGADTVEFGHFSAGFYLSEDKQPYFRIGYSYTIDGVYSADFPVNVPYDTHGGDILIGYQVITDGAKKELWCQFLNMDGDTVVQSESVVFDIPDKVAHMYLQAKTEYAYLYADYLSDTVLYPHMPFDLLGLRPIYDEGIKYGYHDAAYDSVTSFDNMGKLIWTVIDMPFVLVTQVLNFDIFGVNIGNIVLGLVTVGLFVFVLHKVGII